jgi:hypothetical protein
MRKIFLVAIVLAGMLFFAPPSWAQFTSVSATYTVSTNGTLGIVPMTANVYAGQFSLQAKAGTVMQYSTTYSPGGSCFPVPTVQVFPILELQ